MCSLILWRRWNRTTCRFLELFFWVAPFSPALCLVNPSPFSLPKLHCLFPQLSKTTIFYLSSLALLCSSKYSPRQKARVSETCVAHHPILENSYSVSFVHFPRFLWWESKSSTSYSFRAKSISPKESFFIFLFFN